MIKEFFKYNLRILNTFRMDVSAERFITFDDENDIQEIEKKIRHEPFLILGGGSNMLLTSDFKGCVLHPHLKGIQLIEEKKDYVLVNVKAGINWDDFVEYAVNKGWGGVENLSLIPGNTGACPIQNIGAYGVEVKDVIEKVRFYDFKSLQFEELSASECQFGYRDSIYKKKLKNTFLITDVTFRLSTSPVYNIEYGSVGEELKKFSEINLHNIRQAIINIRSFKLPNPAVIPNCGSFFKNPVVSKIVFEVLQKTYQKVPHYTVNDAEEKIPAAWLIEQCGWKGYREGDAGVHVNQPLVLVNYGNATGKMILELAEKIIASVQKKFNIKLEMEVNVI